MVGPVKNVKQKEKWFCTNKPTTDFLVVGPARFSSTPLSANQKIIELNSRYRQRPGCVLTVSPREGSGTGWIQLA